MKNNGIVRKVDELGRIVIPIEMREKLKIKRNDELEILTNGNTIMLRKYSKSCEFCGGKGEIKFKEKLLCKKCCEELKQLN